MKESTRIVARGVFAFAFAAMASGVAGAGEVDVRSIGVKSSAAWGLAESELLKHLELVCGAKPDGSGRVKILLGERAPGEKEPAAFTSYGRRVGDTIYLWGDDSGTRRTYPGRPGTLYAVYGFLEDVFGIRWVCPGNDGIVFRKAEKVEIPDEWSWTYCPPLKMGHIRTYFQGYSWFYGKPPKKPTAEPKANRYLPMAMRVSPDEALERSKQFWLWTRRMRQQDREPPTMGHAFTDWNKRFIDSHPEYLALDASGRRGTRDFNGRRNKFMKLCVSNDAVVDQIVADWNAAGRSKYMNICPNDGSGFCVCEKCRALDCPGPDGSTGHMTDRYVNFWNRIAAKAIALRPDVQLCTYAYGSYRFPPQREKIAFPDNIIFGMVPSMEDDNEAMIKAWRDVGMRHFTLRPNYLCYRGALPRGLERELIGNFKMNMHFGMVGCDYDGGRSSCVMEFELYAVARAIADPEISFEQVEREYLAQFGAAAPIMGEYYARVRERCEKVLYGMRGAKAGGKEKVLDDSQLQGRVLRSNPRSELEADLAVLKRAEAVEGLSPVEARRVKLRTIACEHMIRTQAFLAGRDSLPPEAFGEMALDLLEYRIGISKVLQDNWGAMFRGWPEEVRWWRAPGVFTKVKGKYPEVNLED
jgi:hypothetical protein